MRLDMTQTISGSQVFQDEVSGTDSSDTLSPKMKAQDELRPATAAVKLWPIIVCVGGFIAQYVGMNGKIDQLIDQSKLQTSKLDSIEKKIAEHDTFIAVLRDRETRAAK